MQPVIQNLENEADLARLWRGGKNSREKKQHRQNSQIHLHLEWITLHIQVPNIVRDHICFLNNIF